MKKIALFVAVCYLQGCVTPKVLDLAEGKDKTEVPVTADVESAWRNPTSQEYVICMKDYMQKQDKKRARFTLRIPENLIPEKLVNEGESGFIKFSKRSVLEIDSEDFKYSRPGKERDSVQVYHLTLPVETGCDTPNPQWAKLQLLRAPKDIDTNDAMLFRGEKLRQIIARQQPFAIISSPISDRTAITPELFQEPQLSVCNKITSGTCLQLVTKPQVHVFGDPQFSYSEILIPDQLIWSYNPKTAWYWALPFAVIADTVVVVFAMIDISFGGHGPKIP
jgi:hypothetical protein